MISTLEKIRRLEEQFTLNNSNIDPAIETTINKLLAREHNRLMVDYVEWAAILDMLTNP